MTQPISRHAVVFGALGQGNRGDDALLAAIVEWMNDRYDALTIMLLAPDPQLVQEIRRLTTTPVVGEPMPPMYSRKRPWCGHRARSTCRSRIAARLPAAQIDAFWIGGLLGPIWQHNRVRCLELKWAAQFAHTLTYFFGDVAESFAETPYARRWVRLADSLNMRIAVRSREAAEQLQEAGMQSAVRYGLDAVLYSRCLQRGLPFRKVRPSDAVTAFNPCATRCDQWEDVWLELAEAAADRNLLVRWISTCDTDDLALCQRLAVMAANRRPGLRQEVVTGRDAEAALASARYAVASRYHGTIFALAAGVPTMVCPYAVKVERLCEFLRLGQFTFSPETSCDDVRGRASAMMDEIDCGRWQLAHDVLANGVRQHEEVSASLEDALFKNADRTAGGRPAHMAASASTSSRANHDVRHIAR